YGFSFASIGALAAEYLFNKIMKAVKNVNEEKMNINLKMLLTFWNPKDKIEHWFKKMGDGSYLYIPQKYIIRSLKTNSVMLYIKSYLDKDKNVEFKAIEEASEENR
ncbi:21476_t:CDS:2, partial [Gigaspora rosea]